MSTQKTGWTVRALISLGTLLILTAAPQTFASGSCTLSVTGLTYSEGNTVLSVSYTVIQGSPNPDACQSSTYLVLAYTSSLPDREHAMQAALLSAYMTQRPVTALLSGCLPGVGGSTYPQLYYVTI